MKIILERKENAFKLDTQGEVSFEQVVELLLNGIRLVAKDLVEKHPDHSELKGNVYDLLNVGFSNLLQDFAPEFEPHPEMDIHEALANDDAVLATAYAMVKDKQ